MPDRHVITARRVSATTLAVAALTAVLAAVAGWGLGVLLALLCVAFAYEGMTGAR